MVALFVALSQTTPSSYEYVLTRLDNIEIPTHLCVNVIGYENLVQLMCEVHSGVRTCKPGTDSTFSLPKRN